MIKKKKLFSQTLSQKPIDKEKNFQKEWYLFLLKKKIKKNKIKKKNEENKKQHASSFYLTKSIDRVCPLLDLQRVRRKGRTYFIPYEITKEKARIQAIKWLKEGSQKNSKGKTQSVSKALAQLFLESSKGIGYVQKKQKEQHSLAFSNRSYVRFRWW